MRTRRMPAASCATLKQHFDPDNLMNPGGTLGLDLPEDQKRDFINK